MRSLGLKPSDQELTLICADRDAHGKPILSFKRFVFLMTSQEDSAVQMGLKAQVNEFRETFALLDTNQSGTVEADELLHSMRAFGLQTIYMAEEHNYRDVTLADAEEVIADIEERAAIRSEVLSRSAETKYRSVMPRTPGAMHFIDFCMVIAQPRGLVQLAFTNKMKSFRELGMMLSPLRDAYGRLIEDVNDIGKVRILQSPVCSIGPSRRAEVTKRRKAKLTEKVDLSMRVALPQFLQALADITEAESDDLLLKMMLYCVQETHGQREPPPVESALPPSLDPAVALVESQPPLKVERLTLPFATFLDIMTGPKTVVQRRAMILLEEIRAMFHTLAEENGLVSPQKLVEAMARHKQELGFQGPLHTHI